MEITISPELEDCPLLLKTYIYLFENVPTLLGLPKASVSGEISSHKGLYTIKVPRTSYIFYLFSNIKQFITGYQNAVILMEELETQSLKMEKLLEEKSELVRIMSHDISNLSLAIGFSLEKILKKENLSNEDKVILTEAKKSSLQLSIILKNVQQLEVSQIKGIHLEAVNLNDIFNSMEEHFKNQLLAKNVSLIIQNNLPAHISPMAEKSSLEFGVFSNLINNAIKFSTEGSTVTLEAFHEKNRAIVVIKDQGTGISQEDRKILFTKKLRKSTLGTKGEMGTGLGLGIVSTYIRLYNGEVSAHQNFPTGTIIKISLPVFDQHFKNN
jgi:signal transduction histidine kinase